MSTTPSRATLGDQVHLWQLDLDHRAAAAPDDSALLSADETERAGRFRFEGDRRRFVAGRAALRRILGGYLDSDPAQLQFTYGPAGKPALSGQPAGATLSFNLSHSAERALLAVAAGRALGTDIERIRRSDDLAAVAGRFFARGEIAALGLLDHSLYIEGFFACWTRKEALLKAFGAGLSLPLDGFCVAVDPGTPAALLSTAFRPDEAERWSILDVSPTPTGSPAYRAALAIEGPQPVCRYFQLEP